MRLLFTLLLLVYCHALFAQQERVRVWIDTDNQMGRFGEDVDDGLALMMALHTDKLDIAGISVVENVKYSFVKTHHLLDWYDHSEGIPVYKGADGKEKFGKRNEAVEALADALREERLTILALGPATNLGTLVQLYPELTPRIKQIVLCAGRRPGIAFTPGRGKRELSDYNFELDPHSFEVLLSSGIPLVFVGYEAAESIYLNKNAYRFLKESYAPGSGWVYKQLRSWERVWKVILKSPQGFIPFDVVTLGYLLEPDMIKCEPVVINIEYDSSKKDKPLLLADIEPGAFSSSIYCHSVDTAYRQTVLQLLKRSSEE